MSEWLYLIMPLVFLIGAALLAVGIILTVKTKKYGWVVMIVCGALTIVMTLATATGIAVWRAGEKLGEFLDENVPYERYYNRDDGNDNGKRNDTDDRDGLDNNDDGTYYDWDDLLNDENIPDELKDFLEGILGNGSNDENDITDDILGKDWNTWRSYGIDIKINDDLSLTFSLLDTMNGYAVYDAADGTRVGTVMFPEDHQYEQPDTIHTDDIDGDGDFEFALRYYENETKTEYEDYWLKYDENRERSFSDGGFIERIECDLEGAEDWDD